MRGRTAEPVRIWPLFVEALFDVWPGAYDDLVSNAANLRRPSLIARRLESTDAGKAAAVPWHFTPSDFSDELTAHVATVTVADDPSIGQERLAALADGGIVGALLRQPPPWLDFMSQQRLQAVLFGAVRRLARDDGRLADPVSGEPASLQRTINPVPIEVAMRGAGRVRVATLPGPGLAAADGRAVVQHRQAGPTFRGRRQVIFAAFDDPELKRDCLWLALYLARGKTCASIASTFRVAPITVRKHNRRTAHLLGITLPDRQGRPRTGHIRSSPEK